MQKKIEESKDPAIQTMLMYVRRYIEKHGDLSASAWINHSKPEIIQKIKQKNPQISKMLNNVNSLASYSVMDISTDFNGMEFDSLKSILKRKVMEIHKTNPEIYNMHFTIVT